MWRRPSIVKRLDSIPSNVAVGPRPVDGSQPSMTAKIMIKTNPTQKVGSEKPTIEPAMIVREEMASGLRPA